MTIVKRLLLLCPILLAGIVCRLPAQITITVANAGFESAISNGLPAVNGLPVSFGSWAGDLNASVSANGISPLSGAGMLSLTKMSPDGIVTGTGADTLQLVDMSSYAASIGAGNFTATLSASFNRTASSHTQFEVGIRAYSGLAAAFPTNAPSPLAVQFFDFTSDADTSTWESASVSLLLPTGTSYLEIWVSALSATGNLQTLPDGHYADEVTLTAIPEPSTYALAVGGAALALGVMRRTRRLRAARA